MNGRGPGQPTLLTPEVSARIIDALTGGQFRATAATLAGVHRQRIYEWVEQGNADREAGKVSVFSVFAEDVERVEAEFASKSVALIAAAEKGHKGLQWLLERRFPTQFGRTLKAELSGPEGAPIRVAVDLGALNRRIAALAAGSAPSAPGSAASGSAPEAPTGGTGSDSGGGGES